MTPPPLHIEVLVLPQRLRSSQHCSGLCRTAAVMFPIGSTPVKMFKPSRPTSSHCCCHMLLMGARPHPLTPTTSCLVLSVGQLIVLCGRNRNAALSSKWYVLLYFKCTPATDCEERLKYARLDPNSWEEGKEFLVSILQSRSPHKQYGPRTKHGLVDK